MAHVELRGVVKKFGDVLAVDRVDISAEQKEFVVLLGPSGCGKTTCLRMIAGLETITEGEIYIAGRKVNDILPKDRDIAMVFQNYALYPHMSVYKNMALGLQLQKFPKDEIKKRVEAAAEILEITELLNRKPMALSGGQRQRVAIGRTIVRDPQVFLFDEPLSNLDAKLRSQMRIELAKLHRKIGKSIIYVTHDQIEAMTLADRIVIMNKGKVMQMGKPMEIYNNPANLFVAGFIGSPTMNLLDVKIMEDGGKITLAGDCFMLEAPPDLASRCMPYKEKKAVLGIRPNHICQAGMDLECEGKPQVELEVEVVEPVGSEIVIDASCGKDQFTACIDPRSTVKVGDKLMFTIDLSQIHLFDAESGKGI